ncbi:hypothetical protein HX126_21190 [Chryseobacterium indologenes]|uniref:hypothetical protein n=1 Tax=Chryseobacterium TaxID=59732 RepID=UPI001626B98F|nr:MULTISPECIES: hypothetical protein [Chryseobacterium]MDM1557074.1 hypothetical protein [Chryseobacterium indologenes]
MKSIFFLFLSIFVFGQNINLLQNVQKGSQNDASEFGIMMLPGYKLLDTSSKGTNYFYSYLPSDASQNEIEKCNTTNICDRIVVLKYKVINSVFTFSEAHGDYIPLFTFWKNEIQADPQETNYHTYVYKNKEDKIWFNLMPGTKNKWILRNMSDNSLPW